MRFDVHTFPEFLEAASYISQQDRIVIFPTNGKPIRLRLLSDGFEVLPCDEKGNRT